MVTTWTLFKLFLFLIAFILFYSLLQFLVSTHPPRYTDPTTPETLGLSYKPVSFTTTDNILIKGWLIHSPKAKGTIIIGHGYPFDKGNILQVVTFLYPAYNLLLYDHRYFGESEGKITTVGIRETKDVQAAVQFVQEQYGKKHAISLYGFSLSAAAMLMSETQVKAIIADSPYANLDYMINHIYFYFGPFKYPFVKLTEFYTKLFLGTNINKQSPVVAVQNTTIPILLIHGEQDTQIPVENAYALKKSNPAIELWIVPKADHGQAYALHKKQYEQRITDFLKKHM
tara:strand:- start:14931 stop:15785 length:855 start_codon:yes stop_codon:yes gene_type:complete